MNYANILPHKLVRALNQMTEEDREGVLAFLKVKPNQRGRVSTPMFAAILTKHGYPMGSSTVHRARQILALYEVA